MNSAIVLTGTEKIDFYSEISRFERSLIEKALFYTDGNVKQAAGLMGVGRQTLIYRIAKLGLEHLKNKKDTEK
jgi:DNA-binding NtrC family response regulator